MWTPLGCTRISLIYTAALLLTAAPPLACALTVRVNWSHPLKTVHTAATVEVDVMPQLARSQVSESV